MPALGERLPRTYEDLAHLLGGATAMRRAMNLWPPFLFAGIHITHLSADFRHARVVLRRHKLTANYLGTQYGGSLYSMTDPFPMVMVLRNLGNDYVVWDKRGEIEFVRPGRSAVSTSFDLSAAAVESIRTDAAGGDKVLIWFDNELRDRDDELVATVRKQVYVRLKRDRTGA